MIDSVFPIRVRAPRKFAARPPAWVGGILMPDGGPTAALLLAVEDQIAAFVLSIQADPFG